MRLHLRYEKALVTLFNHLTFLFTLGPPPKKKQIKENIVIKQKKQKIMTECKFRKQKYSPKGETGGEKKKAIYKYNHTYLTIAT